ncbi:hypothetical protein PoB_001646200 [Plakobranchus ocellatus]|uniref:Uncharacterized protein n=1 Tax=Plakobranchus ocellatus TaxID=259542 RepID=A0AAV3Z3Y7_9GAST|nr:hypothetical protein PoB_001646200 [Plakobranchus ocellatus]
MRRRRSRKSRWLSHTSVYNTNGIIVRSLFLYGLFGVDFPSGYLTIFASVTLLDYYGHSIKYAPFCKRELWVSHVSLYSGPVQLRVSHVNLYSGPVQLWVSHVSLCSGACTALGEPC